MVGNAWQEYEAVDCDAPTGHLRSCCIHRQEAGRNEHNVQLPFSFYSAQVPRPWHGTTDIEGRSSHLNTIQIFNGP